MGGKSGSVTSTGTLPPELRGLATSTAKSIQDYAKNNPLGPFGGSYPQPVAGLSYEQRLGLGQIPGMMGADPLSALAVKSILDEPTYAGVTSTSGPANTSGQPSLEDIYAMLGGAGANPTKYTDPAAPYVGFGPAPGPTPGANPGGPGPGTGSPTPNNPDGGPGPGPNTGPQTKSMTPAEAAAAAMMGGGQPGGYGGSTPDNPNPGAPAPAPGPSRPPPQVVPGEPPNTTVGTGPGGVAEPTGNGFQFPGSVTGTTGNIPGFGAVGDAAGVKAGYQQVTGSDIINNPAVAQAMKSFTDTVQPGILNQATLMGLGRSDSANRAVSSAQGQMLVPLYEDAFARENDRLNRGYSATETELARRDAAATRVAQAKSDQANQLAALAGQNFNQKAGAVNLALQGGGVSQGNAQAGADAAWNDFMRRQGLAEQGTFGPFGTVTPATFGSKSISSGK